MTQSTADLFRSIGQDLRELTSSGPRAQLCATASLAVGLATLLTAWLHLPELWWAGISAFISVRATRPASLERAALRISGTASGALLAVLLMPCIADDHAIFCLVLWAVVTIGLLGITVSRFGYVWLFTSVTFALVALAGIDQPMLTLNLAVERTAEVTIGSVAAAAIAWALAPDDPMQLRSPAPPGWRDLMGAQRAALQHALRGGFVVMLMPLLWRWFELPALTQMPVTVVAVLAVPVSTAESAWLRGVIVSRGAQRAIGCLLGGGFGLLVATFSIAGLVPWLILIMAGVWLGAHLQASTRDVSYVGTQGAVAFLITLVQGSGPPDSLLPAIDRFVGITLGVVVLLLLIVALDRLVVRSADL